MRGQLETKFGSLPGWADQRLEEATAIQIEGWSKKFVTAHTLEGVLGKKPTDPFYKNEFVMEAVHNARVALLRTLLTTKFGELPKWADERQDAATSVQVNRWLKKFATADTLESVLGKS